MTKKTPQEFLDSTEFNFMVVDEFLPFWRVLLSKKKPKFGFIIGRWYVDIVDVTLLTFRDCVTLDEHEIDRINWTGFDCSKPLERTKKVKN